TTTSSPTTTAPPQQPSGSNSSSNPSSSSSSNSTSPTGGPAPQDGQISNTGPGDVIALFIGVTLVSATLHYAYQLRRTN
ncbi:MAG TPA: hypothetical protein VFB03_00640, partial [Candidatus Saccharimonadales bacterium]|nr:hypothetical protein [Candidatus Saccharimonadales bacterium]